MARVLQGIAATIVWVAGLALLADTIGTEGLGNAMGITSVGWTIAAVAGPLLGGVVYDRAGYYAVYYMSFGLIAMDALLRITMIEKKVAKKWQEEPSDTAQVVETDREKCATSQSGENGLESAAASGGSPVTNNTFSAQESGVLPPVLTLLASRRMLTAIWGTLVASAIVTSFDSVLPLHVKAIFGVRAIRDI